MSSSPVICVKNIGLAYRLKEGFKRKLYWALKDISFDVYQGETLGIIGRNGAGKSTLLRLLAGVVKPDAGKIESRGLKTSLLSLSLGFVKDLSGRENIFLGAMLLGLSQKEIKKKLPEIIGFAELGEFIDQPVRNYSSGMRSRLGFAVAFNANPDVLLIDEAMSAGDAKFKEKAAEAMHKIINSNKTIVLVSHSTSTISKFCKRVVWIEEGVVRACGNADEIIAEYEKSGKRKKDRA